jgi:seryl-tRNA synthetase
MLDIKFIRENVEFVKKSLATKNDKADIDLLLELDEKKRKTQFDFETLRTTQNKISKEIGQLKKENKNTKELLSAMQNVADDIKSLSQNLHIITNELDAVMLGIPNIPDKSVKVGKSADDNTVIKTWGECRKSDSFKIKEHQEIAVKRGLNDFHRGAKITGSGFPVYTDKGAILERALINFMLDFHILKHGYTEVKVPFIVNRQTMTGTGQLPKFENDMYHVREEDFFLVPTAEVPITNLFADEILQHDQLPIKYVGYTPSFRKEAGSYGKDTKGLQRIHQFNKVEMVRFVKPDDSYSVLEEMLKDAEDILQALQLPYRVLELCTGDMSFANSKTYDLEVWSPATEKFLEVSSVSNFVDFQARRANIRYRDTDGKVKFLHTLNGSGLATPRTYIAILEHYQQEDGSIIVPDVLNPYMLGIDKI